MKAKNELIVRFWGVRGSYPAPGPSTVRYGGNTPCVQVQIGSTTIILDGGTGLIPLGRELVRQARQENIPVEVVLLLSHLHHDHTQGIPFFAPAFIPTSRIYLFGPQLQEIHPQLALGQIMQPPYFPVRAENLRAQLTFDILREGQALALGQEAGGVAILPEQEMNRLDPNVIRIRWMYSYAHPSGVFHYRIEWRGRSVTYATDTEGYILSNRRLLNFADQTDVLIHDAQYTDEHYLGLLPGVSTTQGFGHSTIGMACDTALRCQAQRLVLFHLAPEYDDEKMDRIQVQAQSLFVNTMVAYEGMEIHLEVAEETSNAQSDVTVPIHISSATR